MLHRFIIALGVLPLLVLQTVSASATYYVVTRIPKPTGAQIFALRDINDNGQAAGYWVGPDFNTYHAILWSHETGIQELGEPAAGCSLTQPEAINNDGQIVGASLASTGSDYFAFRWTSGTWENLGSFDGSYDMTISEANDINDSGQVVGRSLTTDPAFVIHAFFYDDALTPPLQDVHDGLAWQNSVLYCINSNGQAAGQSHDDAVVRAADGTTTHLGTLGGIGSVAYGINDQGQVVGCADTSVGNHPFLWTSDGGMQDLTPNSSDAYGRADCINNAGQVGLRSDDLAYLWTSDEGLIDLNTKINPDWGGIDLTMVPSINEVGQLIAQAYYTGMGADESVVLDPALGGDANLDGSVNGTDLNAVLSNYNQTVTQDVYGWMAGDFNDDGSVNGTDLNMILSNYNQSLWSSSAAAVPEPSTLLLVLAAVLSLWAWRKRFGIC